MGYAPGSVQNFVADQKGTHLAFGSTADALVRYRQAIRRGEAPARANPFEGDKPADADAAARRPTRR